MSCLKRESESDAVKMMSLNIHDTIIQCLSAGEIEKENQLKREQLSINNLKTTLCHPQFCLKWLSRQGFLDPKLEKRKNKLAKLRRCVLVRSVWTSLGRVSYILDHWGYIVDHWGYIVDLGGYIVDHGGYIVDHGGYMPRVAKCHIFNTDQIF